MNVTDLIIAGLLAVLIVWILWRQRHAKPKEGACSKNCASCSTGCSSVDWVKIRQEMQEQKEKEQQKKEKIENSPET